jgi:hypothetical protein
MSKIKMQCLYRKDYYVFRKSFQKLSNYLKFFHKRKVTESINCIYKALLTLADVTKCGTETQPKTPNSKQCRCRSTVARKNSLERSEPRKKPKEEPGYEGWPVLFWLCWVEIITWPRCSNVHR